MDLNQLREDLLAELSPLYGSSDQALASHDLAKSMDSMTLLRVLMIIANAAGVDGVPQVELTDQNLSSIDSMISLTSRLSEGER